MTEYYEDFKGRRWLRYYEEKATSCFGSVEILYKCELIEEGHPRYRVTEYKNGEFAGMVEEDLTEFPWADLTSREPKKGGQG